jgi:exodeoxyribonuclease VII small subunit
VECTSRIPVFLTYRAKPKGHSCGLLVSILGSTVECSLPFTNLEDAENFVNQPAPKKPEPLPNKKPNFEQSLGRLEEVVRRLESPQLSLDDAMKLFEEGVELSRECQKQLEEAEGKVEILLKKADGKLTAQPFDPESESEQ